MTDLREQAQAAWDAIQKVPEGVIHDTKTRMWSRKYVSPLLALKAKARLSELLIGATVICSGERDRYDRLLCRVENKGRDVGDTLVNERLVVIRDEWRR